MIFVDYVRTLSSYATLHAFSMVVRFPQDQVLGDGRGRSCPQILRRATL